MGAAEREGGPGAGSDAGGASAPGGGGPAEGPPNCPSCLTLLGKMLEALIRGYGVRIRDIQSRVHTCAWNNLSTVRNNRQDVNVAMLCNM